MEIKNHLKEKETNITGGSDETGNSTDTVSADSGELQKVSIILHYFNRYKTNVFIMLNVAPDMGIVGFLFFFALSCKCSCANAG